jgi:hypothetical protein
MKTIETKFPGQYQTIGDYIAAPEFAQCAKAFLAAGTQEHENHNRTLLKKNQSGHWQITAGRVSPGDLLFLMLPDRKTASKLCREIYAGVVARIDPTNAASQTYVVTVKEFYILLPITNGVRTFLEGKLPTQNRLLGIWNRLEVADKIQLDFAAEVANAMAESSEARRRKLKTDPKIPHRISVTTTVFQRNPRVVAEVLLRASGTCEACHEPAPFQRRRVGGRSGSPYLEVHHIKKLADGGEDTVKNAEALCPNCHREKHFG